MSPKAIFSWLATLWMSFVFLSSLPFKFSKAPETQHIFGTIGDWLGTLLGKGIGSAFREFGGYFIGSLELLTSVVLLLPALLWLVTRLKGSDFGETRRKFHAVGGLMAAALMAGAAFFHLVSPLGINVQGDNGMLFYFATSIVVLGVALFLVNRRTGD